MRKRIFIKTSLLCPKRYLKLLLSLSAVEGREEAFYVFFGRTGEQF